MPHTAYPSLAAALFLVQSACGLFMTGLIWFVQLVHYPLFQEAGSGASLQRYEKLHARRTGALVFPPMLLELLSALAALYPPLRPAFVSLPLAITLASLVVLIWLSTGLVQVRLHEQLDRPLTPEQAVRTIRLLVKSNWLRTVAWTMRSALLLRLIWNALGR